jgi:hypothetical protein
MPRLPRQTSTRLLWAALPVALIALPSLPARGISNGIVEALVSVKRIIRLSDGLVVRANLGDAHERRHSQQQRHRYALPRVASPTLTPTPVPSSETEQGRTLYVAANATSGGDGSDARPFGSIQEALNEAAPGDTVIVEEGDYEGELHSVRSGEPNAPIRIIGRGAHIVGAGADHVIDLNHDYIELRGFEISDGGKLIYAMGASNSKIIGNWLHDAEGECVRFKFFAIANEVAHNRIERCGMVDFDLSDDAKNGEGVYIGTAPEQLDDNPDDRPDASDRNWVHNNTIVVPAECVDVKEHAEANVVEQNHCSGSQDPDGAGFSSRGLGTIFRTNVSSDNAGAGIRLGGDESTDGVNSVVVGNRLIGNQGYGLAVHATPQATICGNEVRDNSAGATNSDADPQASCAPDAP